MKRVFISLSLPFFLTLSYELSAYTRAELTQDKLSKIGIKQEVIDETIKFQYDVKDEKNFFTEDGEENENFTKENLDFLQVIFDDNIVIEIANDNI